MNAYGLFIRSLVIEYRKFNYYKKINDDIILEFEPQRYPAGSSVAKVPENPKDKGSTIIRNMEYIEPYENDLELAISFIEIVDDFIKKIDDIETKKMIIEKFISEYEKCVSRLELDLYITNKSIWTKLDKEIEIYVRNYPMSTRM